MFFYQVSPPEPRQVKEVIQTNEKHWLPKDIDTQLDHLSMFIMGLSFQMLSFPLVPTMFVDSENEFFLPPRENYGSYKEVGSEAQK